MNDYGPHAHWLLYLVDTLPEKREADEVQEDGGGIAGLVGARVESLATIVSDIQSELAKRSSLSRAVLDCIEEHYLYVKAKLLELERWPLSSDRAIEQRRSKLEGTLDQLAQELRRERVQCWQDKSRLKSELWRWFKEYSDLAGRMRLIDDDGKGTRG